MFNELIVATVTPFSGTESPDKNGLKPVMLQCRAGRMPNRNVLSGTVAERGGFEIGHTYLIQVREDGFDEQFGPDFSFQIIMEIDDPMDIVKLRKELGRGEVLTIPRPEGFDDMYERVTTKVVGNKRTRIQEGKYKPVSTRSFHEAADVVDAGTNPEEGEE